jgi:asparagine synthase (glutamine-hydrolysing)
MFRFLVFIWDSADQSGCDSAYLLAERLMQTDCRWMQAYCARGMLACHTVDESSGKIARPLQHHVGIVLGSLFRRSQDEAAASVPSPAEFDSAESRKIHAGGGKSLITDHWGDYVAVLSTGHPSRISIIKDPAGNLPAYITRCRNLTILFSHVADCLSLKCLRFTVNHGYVKKYLLFYGQEVDLEALNEIVTVRRGECLTIDTRLAPWIAARTFVWHPQRFSEAADIFDDVEQATRAIRLVTRASTQSLAFGHNHVIARLSGGLDSSIVTGCLADSPSRPQLLCHTYYARGTRSDERLWARAVIEHVKARHIEWSVPEDVRLEASHRLLPSTQPVGSFPYLTLEPAERRMAAEFGATAVFTGHGGDAVFGNNAALFSVDAYIRRHGIRPRVLCVAAGAARFRDQLAWTLIAQSVRRLLFGSRLRDFNRAYTIRNRLLNPDFECEGLKATRHPHPWFSGQEDIPWSTVLMLGELGNSPEQFGHFSRTEDPAVERLMPLLSQRAMETFLRIPTYLHLKNGRNRGLARDAFTHEVPRAVLRRTWKDRGPSYLEAIVHRNLKFLKEVLLDGYLVKEKLLAPAALSEVVSETSSKIEYYCDSLLFFTDIETWLHKWPNAVTTNLGRHTTPTPFRGD